MSNFYKIVLDENNGKVLNELYEIWSSVKTNKQYADWVKKVKSIKFGTHGTVSIIEVLDNFNPKFPNEIIKKDFYNELKQAIK